MQAFVGEVEAQCSLDGLFSPSDSLEDRRERGCTAWCRSSLSISDPELLTKASAFKSMARGFDPTLYLSIN